MLIIHIDHRSCTSLSLLLFQHSAKNEHIEYTRHDRNDHKIPSKSKLNAIALPLNTT